MAALPVDILLGVYLGLLAGIVPALTAGFLGFLFRYFTGVTLPGFGVVVLSVAIAGVNGGLMGLIDPTVKNSPRLLVALVVVMMISLYAHSQGDKLGVALPRRFSLRALRKRTLSAEVVDFVGGIGTVTIRPTGPVEDMEGYPPLPADVRAAVAADAWEFPGDLPLSELETRLTERLRTTYDLAAADVAVDDRGRARIAAAPPMGALSDRVPAGHRAVSIDALVPTGMTRGESLTVLPTATRELDPIEGTLLSAHSKGFTTPDPPAPPGSGSDPGPLASGSDPPSSGGSDSGSGSGSGSGPPVTDGGETATDTSASLAPTTAGGEGRVTVAVPGREATTLLSVDRGRVLVRSRGTRQEFEMLGLVRRAGKRIARLTVRSGGPLDGTTIGDAAVRETYSVAVLAVRPAPSERVRGRKRERKRDRKGDRAVTGGQWVFSPRGRTELSGGDELFVVGTRDALDRFREAVA